MKVGCVLCAEKTLACQKRILEQLAEMEKAPTCRGRRERGKKWKLAAIVAKQSGRDKAQIGDIGRGAARS